MRILHLSTGSTGGAGKCASRLHYELQAAGHLSKMVTRSNLPISTKALSKFSTILGKINSNKSYEFLSTISVSSLHYEEVFAWNPDIIHIHNWYNLLNLKDFYKLSDLAPIVFTMHDERLVTGGCHVTLNCENFKKNCHKCPAAKFKNPVEIAQINIERIYNSGLYYGIISPSHWISKKIQDTTFFANAQSSNVIRNYSTFQPKENIILNSKIDHIRIGFISAQLDSNFKGLNFLIESLTILLEQPKAPELKIELILVGKRKNVKIPEVKNLKLEFVGTLDTRQIGTLISSLNFLVVPSLSENYPGVIAEAQSLGVPVVATNVGGISEMIHDGQSGFLSEPNTIAFSQKLMEAFGSKKLNQILSTAKKRVEEDQNSTVITNAHIDVYQNLLSAYVGKS